MDIPWRRIWNKFSDDPLKARQDLGCFPAPVDMHGDTVAHLASQLALAAAPQLLDESRRKTTLHHYRAAVRIYLNASPYTEAGEQLVTATVLEAATTMSDPADLINRAIEALGKAATDLPAFSAPRSTRECMTRSRPD